MYYVLVFPKLRHGKGRLLFEFHKRVCVCVFSLILEKKEEEKN